MLNDEIKEASNILLNAAADGIERGDEVYVILTSEIINKLTFNPEIISNFHVILDIIKRNSRFPEESNSEVMQDNEKLENIEKIKELQELYLSHLKIFIYEGKKAYVKYLYEVLCRSKDKDMFNDVIFKAKSYLDSNRLCKIPSKLDSLNILYDTINAIRPENDMERLNNSDKEKMIEL